MSDEKILSFNLPQRLMAEMREAIYAHDVKEIARLYYEMWPDEKPPHPKPQEALAAPLEPRCPRCGNQTVMVGVNGVVCMESECRQRGTFAQFFTAQPPSAMTEPESEETHYEPQQTITPSPAVLKKMGLQPRKAAEPHTLTLEVQALETNLIHLTARVARGNFTPDLEGCKTIRDARLRMERADRMRVDLVGNLNAIREELKSLSLPSTRPSGGVVFSPEGIDVCRKIIEHEYQKNPENFRAALKVIGLEYLLPAPPTEEKGPKGTGICESSAHHYEKGDREPSSSDKS